MISLESEEIVLKDYMDGKIEFLKEIYNLGDILPHLKQIELVLKNCQKRPVFRAVFLGFFQYSIFCRTFYLPIPMPQEKKVLF